MVETSGAEGEVLKFLPPLTIDETALDEGLGVIEDAVAAVLGVEPRGALDALNAPAA
jgi:diaminobutyrate-2-oxoglutarate transaminase